MKRLILFELMILFLATTFESDSPPGWFQQTIAIGNKQITDIHFLDTSNGYVVTDWGPAFDTGYVFKTIDGGSNWNFQYRFKGSFTAIQMTDVNTGYITGSTGSGKVWKTTNSGINWNIQFNFSANPIRDLSFTNNNTGWVCSDDPISGGIFKTTTGGASWQTQLGASFSIKKLFFISKDTGWAGSDEANPKLYRTTNGGTTWTQVYMFNGSSILSMFFLNGLNGFVGGAGSGNIKYTTDGGFNWTISNGEVGGYDIKFINDSVGFAGGGSQPLRILKTTNNGITWWYQNASATPDISVSILRNDTSNAWAGKQILIHTTDGGGQMLLGITNISSEVPEDYKLYQNYPNPFNPTTNIKYSIMSNVKSAYGGQMSNVKLTVFDITGKEIAVLVDEEQSAGTYLADWNASGYSSGIYFYSLIIDGKITDTKRMVLIK